MAKPCWPATRGQAAKEPTNTMWRSVLHIVAAIAWVVGSFVAWINACLAFGQIVAASLDATQQGGLPDWMFRAYRLVALGGGIVIPAIVGLLAWRGYLPGTRMRAPERPGFPIGPKPPADPE